MNQEQKRSIAVLNRCLNLRIGEDCDEKEAGRQQRLDELIGTFTTCKKPTIQYVFGWYFCVPESFRAALDIALTPRIMKGNLERRWTQGSRFHFEEGDTLYDSVKAYSPWNLKNIGMCLDIRKASPAKPAGMNSEVRVEGTVIFDVLTPNEKQTQLEKRKQIAMTQDEFVRMLILGPPSEWNEFVRTKRARRSVMLQNQLPF